MTEKAKKLMDEIFMSYADSKELKQMRIDLGLRQCDIADMFDMTRPAVNHIETGRTKHPMILLSYKIVLERLYFKSKGYVPCYRKIGTSEFWEGEKHP